MSPVAPNVFARSTPTTEPGIQRPRFGHFRGIGHGSGRSPLHRIENAEGQHLREFRGELRDATRRALWVADSAEEAGVTVGNAIRDVLTENGFDVDEVLNALQERQSFGPRGRSNGPYGLGALRHAEPLVETAPVAPPVQPVVEPVVQPTPALTTEAIIDVDDSVASTTIAADSVDEVEHDDHSKFEFEFEVEIETDSTKFKMKVKLEGSFPSSGSDNAGFEAARTVVDTLFAQFAPGSLLSTTA